MWICETVNLYVSILRYAKGQTDLEILTGETPNISEYLDYEFYDWVNNRSNGGIGEISIGRWIGVSHKVRNLVSYCILTVVGRPISCMNFQWLTGEDQAMD